jgi:tagatose-1,6-bisphosphate aldolase
MTTLGKYRHLMQASTAAGHFCILAIDHRENLRADLQKHSGGSIDDATIIAFKRDIIRALLPAASGLLTDPAFGIGSGIVGGYIDGRVGLLSPLEVTDYTLHPSRRSLERLPGWSVRKIKQVGGSGVKLLVFYHPDTPAAATVRAEVAVVVEECRREDIPLYLEPIAYSPDESQVLTNADLLRVLLDAAHTFSAMGVDVLKLQFPVDAKQDTDEGRWRAALRELDAACAVPWALLSAGVDYATFERQARLACKAGASGVIVGRAVWSDAEKYAGAARTAWLESVGRERMGRLAALCAAGQSWQARTPAPVITPDWYAGYAVP